MGQWVRAHVQRMPGTESQGDWHLTYLVGPETGPKSPKNHLFEQIGQELFAGRSRASLNRLLTAPWRGFLGVSFGVVGMSQENCS